MYLHGIVLVIFGFTGLLANGPLSKAMYDAKCHPCCCCCQFVINMIYIFMTGMKNSIHKCLFLLKTKCSTNGDRLVFKEASWPYVKKKIDQCFLSCPHVDRSFRTIPHGHTVCPGVHHQHPGATLVMADDNGDCGHPNPTWWKKCQRVYPHHSLPYVYSGWITGIEFPLFTGFIS